jgi:hypothetical protein
MRLAYWFILCFEWLVVFIVVGIQVDMIGLVLV